MSSYFRNVPNFEYVSRVADKKNIGDYIAVKNLFKRVRLSDDLFNNLQYFSKYSIVGDERPDNVAFKFYGDETLDWIVLLSNNIIDVREEWPMPQSSLDNYLLKKYGSYENLEKVKYYKTIEVKNSQGLVIVPKGLIVPQDYSITFYDYFLDREVIETDITEQFTFYDYEIEIENAKRNIYLLDKKYLNLFLNDVDLLMEYKEGSEQFVSRTLKRADNIRLYE